MDRRNHGRAPGMTQTSISLSGELLARLKAMSASDRRSVSTMVSLILERAVKEYAEGIPANKLYDIPAGNPAKYGGPQPAQPAVHRLPAADGRGGRREPA